MLIKMHYKIINIWTKFKMKTEKKKLIQNINKHYNTM